MEKKRNVMWRACLDLQDHLEELTEKRVEVANGKKIKAKKRIKVSNKVAKKADTSPS